MPCQDYGQSLLPIQILWTVLSDAFRAPVLDATEAIVALVALGGRGGGRSIGSRDRWVA